MITLYNQATDAKLGTIADADLEVLREALEEESTEDRDYYIDEPTIELLEQRGATPQMVAMLRAAVGSSEGLEIRWERT